MNLREGMLVRVLGWKIPGTVVRTFRSRALGVCVTVNHSNQGERHFPITGVSPLCGDCTTDFDKRGWIGSRCPTCDALREKVSA